jgi:chromosome segregation ATPase
MDMRSRIPALAAFLVFAAVLGWAGYSLQQLAQRTQHDVQQLAAANPPPARESLFADNSSDAGFFDSRVESWRTQVDQLTVKVNRLASLLEQKSSDYDALKRDYDHNAELLRELLESGESRAKPANAAEAEAKAKSTDATATVKDESTTAANSTDDSAALSTMLREARSKLAALESQAELDQLNILELHERERYLKTAASAALAQAGSAAVPGLIELLADRRPEIRRWAAQVLGEIGPDAEDALDALELARADPDEEVRTAVGKALRRIAP